MMFSIFTGMPYTCKVDHMTLLLTESNREGNRMLQRIKQANVLNDVSACVSEKELTSGTAFGHKNIPG
jgi:muramoyltetrapeptide carboxypeptidase LdcA involved in peptidoglycan recycling